MTEEIAQWIEYLRTGPIMHSWRSISEIICDDYPEFVEGQGWEVDVVRGNQLHGVDLCREAQDYLGVTKDEREKWGE